MVVNEYIHTKNHIIQIIWMMWSWVLSDVPKVLQCTEDVSHQCNNVEKKDIQCCRSIRRAVVPSLPLCVEHWKNKGESQHTEPNDEVWPCEWASKEFPISYNKHK